jgi:hypothetical protein
MQKMPRDVQLGSTNRLSTRDDFLTYNQYCSVLASRPNNRNRAILTTRSKCNQVCYRAVQGQTKSVTAVSNVGAPALFDALVNRCPYDVSSGRLTLSAANSRDQFGIYTQVGALFSGLAPTRMVISTGKVADVKTGSTPSTAFNFTSVGDVHLQALVPGQNIADLARFEIDVSAAQDASISFSFVFASKEYNMGNSDVFGFWVNGVNLAQIRGQSVTTRNVNCGISGTNINGPNCDQYIYNVAQRGTSFPGYTKTQKSEKRIKHDQDCYRGHLLWIDRRTK